MEFICGNIFVRRHTFGMSKGETVIAHKHNFDHMTQVLKGSLRIGLLEVSKFNAAGDPIEAETVLEKVISADDDINFMLVLKGRFHIITSLEDGTRYQCIYSHQVPQAITMHSPGGRIQAPYTKVDDNGDTWYRLNPKVSQDETSWVEQYR